MQRVTVGAQAALMLHTDRDGQGGRRARHLAAGIWPLEAAQGAAEIFLNKNSISNILKKSYYKSLRILRIIRKNVGFLRMLRIPVLRIFICKYFKNSSKFENTYE